MLARIYSVGFTMFFLAYLAVAMPRGDTYPTTTVTVTAPAPPATAPAGGQCNTGKLQCCNSVEQAKSQSANFLLGLLGIVVSDVNVLLGINCSPINIIGGGGNSCTANPVCCQDNSHGGLISIGCIPISL